MTEAAAASSALTWARRGRVIAAFVVAIAIIVLAALALATGTDGFAVVRPAAAAPAPPTSGEPTPTTPPAHRPVAPPAARSTAVVTGAATAAPAAAPTTTVVMAVPIAAPAETGGTPALPPPAPCPYAIGPDTNEGGLQNLIGIVPAFGPFSAEAFAFAPAMQPMLRLFGPFLPTFASTLDPATDPLAQPLLDAMTAFTTAGYSMLAPLYAPHRAGFIEAETQLANALAPYAQQLAGSALATCVVELESVLAPKS